MTQPIGKQYKPWLIASLTILVGSLMVLAIDGSIAFLQYADKATPICITALGAIAILGIITGFGGFLLLMLVAGWASFKESRRVQILPPE